MLQDQFCQYFQYALLLIYRKKETFTSPIIALSRAEGFYDYTKNQYIYQYRDHLGNTRISFGRNSLGNLELVDNNDYYPFGMNHLKSGTSFFGTSSYKNYKYNGKELQESGMYDYGARMYMADIGKWGAVDPLAEKYQPMSTYNYGGNNPIRFIDPNGMNLDTWELNESTGDLNKVEDNDRPDELYIVDKNGNRKVDNNGDQVKFTMERDGQIEERIQSTSSVEYDALVNGEFQTKTKDVPFEIYKFEDQKNAVSFFEFLEKNAKVGNEYDMLQYTQGNIDKGMVGRTLQFKHLMRKGPNGQIGGFIPSLQLDYYLNFFKTAKNIQLMKNVYTHSHPNDGITPSPSPPDELTAADPTIPIPTFRVYSGGIYKTFKPK